MGEGGFVISSLGKNLKRTKETFHLHEDTFSLQGEVIAQGNGNHAPIKCHP